MSRQGARLQTSLDTQCTVVQLALLLCYRVLLALCSKEFQGHLKQLKTRGAGFVDENRKKEMRGKSWWVPNLIAETKFKMADT